MGAGPQTPDGAHPPRWMLVLAPLVALVASCTDVIVLLAVRPAAPGGDARLALLSTVPISVGAYLWTFWVLARLRREVIRRVRSEAEVRSALLARESALAETARALERERLLRRELDHRVRNNLAALMGLVGVYEESGRQPGHFADSLRGKIGALREAYGLISLSGPEGVDLESLLRTMAAAHVPSEPRARFSASGPGVRLMSREASALAIIAQELFTNSLKHGALRRENGAISVRWTAGPPEGGSHRLALHWEEAPVRAGPRGPGGAGLSLVRGFAEGDLRGRVSFESAGDRWVVDLEAGVRVAEPSPTPAAATHEVHA